MGGLTEGLAVRLREKKPKSLQEAAEMADDYVTARKAEGREVLPKGTLYKTEPKPIVNSGVRTQPSPAPERSRTNAREEKQCYRCHGWGHVSYNCPQAKATPGPNAQPKALYEGVCEKSSACWKTGWLPSGDASGHWV